MALHPLWQPGRERALLYAPGTRLRHGRYHIEGLYAAGGVSEVYLAVEHAGWRPRRLVAIKAALPREASSKAVEAAEERLAHEAILLRLVDCWRVPQVLGLFEEQGRPHLAMEYVPGATLEQLFVDTGGGTCPPWRQRDVVSLGRALADLLQCMHSGPTPILLRDLKPANLIVTPEGHVKYVDFGIACPLRPGLPIPVSERWLGTRGYAAPEQWGGDGLEDERVDLFALGAILYRAATGRDLARYGLPTVPALGDHSAALSPRLTSLIGALLSHDPRGRPADATSVARQLAALAPTTRRTTTQALMASSR